MIYSIFGTDVNKRKQAISKLSGLNISTHLYSENYLSLRPLIEANSLFGDKISTFVIQMMDEASSKNELLSLISDMKDSQNVFIIDEPNANQNVVKQIGKYAEEIFDCREEKGKEANPFSMTNAFLKRDKKNAWLEFMKIKENESMEAIHGALWWRMKTIWEDVLNKRGSKYTKNDCENFGGKIVRSVLDAHNGEKELDKELEKIILSI